jgi:putative sterol carrier protein
MEYTDAGQFQTVLNEVMARGENGAAATALKKAELAVGFWYHEPELRLQLRGSKDAVTYTFGEDLTGTDVTFESSAGVGHRFWMGELNALMAIMNGEIKVVGSMSKAMPLLPAMPELQAYYRVAYAARGTLK